MMGDGDTSMAGFAILVFVFAAYFLAFEAIFLSFSRRGNTRERLASRLAKKDRPNDQGRALVKTRRKRGLSADGHYTMAMMWLNRLIAQSGVSLGANGFRLVFMAFSSAVLLVTLFATGSIVWAALAGLAAGAGLPVAALAFLRRRRVQKFETHLPEAIDTLVRSMRAGHPVQAAVRMVVRELPDPVGTEFGMVADELTYGLDLETAMKNMNGRVGQQDLGLVVAAITMQTKSGGNLAEILGNLSKVIRDRARMRLKVKALSAEARYSALVLSLLPAVLFAVLWLIAPGYYGDVWKESFVKPVLIGAFAWMLAGDLVMYRMVRFEI